MPNSPIKNLICTYIINYIIEKCLWQKKYDSFELKFNVNPQKVMLHLVNIVK